MNALAGFIKRPQVDLTQRYILLTNAIYTVKYKLILFTEFTWKIYLKTKKALILNNMKIIQCIGMPGIKNT